MSTVYPKHHHHLRSSWSSATFIAAWLIGPSVATERALDDQRLGNCDDTIFCNAL